MKANVFGNLIKGCLIMLFIFLFGASAKSQTTATFRLQPEDQTASNQFKSLAGQERFNVFKQLENLIKPAQTFDGPAPQYDYFIGDYKITADELIYLLGEPDVRIAKCMYQYNLRPSDGCKVIIGIDENGLVSYMVIKDCQ